MLSKQMDRELGRREREIDFALHFQQLRGLIEHCRDFCVLYRHRKTPTAGLVDAQCSFVIVWHETRKL
jgi:hypothetical protein